MTEPIVFISRNRVAPGGSDAVTAAIEAAVSLIDKAKPRTTLFAAYLDEPGSTLSVVHVFADQMAMTEHFVGSDDRSEAVSELIAPMAFVVYGAAPPAAVEQLRIEALRGGGALELHPRAIGGFLRGDSELTRTIQMC